MQTYRLLRRTHKVKGKGHHHSRTVCMKFKLQGRGGAEAQCVRHVMGNWDLRLSNAQMKVTLLMNNRKQSTLGVTTKFWSCT